RMFGTVLENVMVDPETRTIDLESAAITENTRASYPIHFIPKHVAGGMAGHPSHIVLLTCDAYGIMPPIARLSPAQAMYHFLSGYTARVAGPVFGLEVPLQVPGVPEDVLLPRATWPDPTAYDAQAAKLAQMFRQNFEQFQDHVHAAVRDAGPSR